MIIEQIVFVYKGKLSGKIETSDIYHANLFDKSPDEWELVATLNAVEWIRCNYEHATAHQPSPQPKGAYVPMDIHEIWNFIHSDKSQSQQDALRAFETEVVRRMKEQGLV